MATKQVNGERIKCHITDSVHRGGNASNELLSWIDVAIQEKLWNRDETFGTDDEEPRKFESLVEWLTYSPPPGCGVPLVASDGCIEITLAQIMQYAEDQGRSDIADALKIPKGKAGRPKKTNGKSQPRGCNLRERSTRKATLLTRLMDEHPAIYDEYRRGLYRSVRAASEAAGLVKPGHDPVMRMKAYWKKANTEQREEFKRWLRTKEAK